MCLTLFPFTINSLCRKVRNKIKGRRVNLDDNSQYKFQLTVEMNEIKKTWRQWCAHTQIKNDMIKMCAPEKKNAT